MFVYTEEKEVNDRKTKIIAYFIDCSLKLSIGIYVKKDIHDEGDYIIVCNIEINV